MLFRKKIARSCTYCEHGTAIDNHQILCIKRGVVSSEHSCRKFCYAPCKRIPPKMRALDLEQYKDTDFSL